MGTLHRPGLSRPRVAPPHARRARGDGDQRQAVALLRRPLAERPGRHGQGSPGTRNAHAAALSGPPAVRRHGPERACGTARPRRNRQGHSVPQPRADLGMRTGRRRVVIGVRESLQPLDLRLLLGHRRSPDRHCAHLAGRSGGRGRGTGAGGTRRGQGRVSCSIHVDARPARPSRPRRLLGQGAGPRRAGRHSSDGRAPQNSDLPALRRHEVRALAAECAGHAGAATGPVRLVPVGAVRPLPGRQGRAARIGRGLDRGRAGPYGHHLRDDLGRRRAAQGEAQRLFQAPVLDFGRPGRARAGAHRGVRG